MYDIIIIGAGTAGLTAAIYGRRALKKTLVLESKTYGGQIINTLNIENYPAEEHISGFDFATKLYRQAENLGTEFIFEKVTGIKTNEKTITVQTDEASYETKSLIIATGSENRKLNLPNEEKLIGKGISYCATCDGNFFKNKTVAVVGGGNTALEDAEYLSGIAKKVYLIHRRNDFRGDDTTAKRLNEKKNVEFILNSNIIKLNAKEKLESIVIENNDEDEKDLSVDGLFVAIGRIPATKPFTQQIKLDESGYIIANENCHTNKNGIFVAGDNRTKDIRQLVTAASDGAIAATEAIRYINDFKN